MPVTSPVKVTDDGNAATLEQVCRGVTWISIYDLVKPFNILIRKNSKWDGQSGQNSSLNIFFHFFQAPAVTSPVKVTDDDNEQVCRAII